MPWGHFSHVADVSGLSAQTLAPAAHANTNVSLPSQVPACGHGFIIPDFESPLASCLVRTSTVRALGKVWFPDRKANVACETGFPDLLVAFTLETLGQLTGRC